MHNMPDMRVRWLDLQEHVALTKLDFGLVNVWGLAVFKSNITQEFKLVPEGVRDIHGQLVLLISEIPGEAVHHLGGRTGVKLCIKSVPILLVWWENFHNVTQISDRVLHLKL